MSKAKPMTLLDREMNYIRQTGSLVLTPRQARRCQKKLRRWMKLRGES